MNEPQACVPRIGVSVVIFRLIGDKTCVLMGKRKGAHGAGTWSFPGGHLEWFEEVEACAYREVVEETGLHIAQLSRKGYTDFRFIAEQKHYITLILHAVLRDPSAEPELLEPDKCEGWQWFPVDALPEPLFGPIGEYRSRLANTVVVASK